MCTEYRLFTNPEEIANELGSAVENATAEKSWDLRVRLTNKAPVILKTKNKLQLDEYTFPVNPFPNSRLSGLDAKTLDEDDPQVRRIYELPTWKEAFQKTPCLVPMSGFVEPVYWGSEAGTAQEFRPAEKKLFFVAGIVIHGRVPKTSQAFSLLTHTPSAQMLKYHHRLLVMLKLEDALTYLELESSRERFDFLIEHRWIPELKIQKDRNLAKGWEKKIDSHKASLEGEKKYISVLKHEGIQA
jgi:putative SOS response-associated peptidase YedK